MACWFPHRGPAPTLELVSTLDGPANLVVVDGDYAYVSADNELRVVDLSEPARPTVTGSLSVIGRIYFIYALDQTAPHLTDRTRVAPRTIWGVACVQQEFGSATSTAGLMVTAVHRDLDEGAPLAARLTRNAFTVSGDSLLRFRGGEYELRLEVRV